MSDWEVPAIQSLDPNATEGQVIAYFRKRLAMSQQTLAKFMREHGQDHWRQTTVSRVENGNQTIDVSERRALAQILGNDILLPLTLSNHGDMRHTSDGSGSTLSVVLDKMQTVENAQLSLQKALSELAALLAVLQEETHIDLDKEKKKLPSAKHDGGMKAWQQNEMEDEIR